MMEGFAVGFAFGAVVGMVLTMAWAFYLSRKVDE